MAGDVEPETEVGGAADAAPERVVGAAQTAHRGGEATGSVPSNAGGASGDAPCGGAARPPAEVTDEYQRPPGAPEPIEPTREERLEHELLGHVSFRSWCRHCVANRGVGSPHRSVPENPREATVPEVVLDY